MSFLKSYCENRLKFFKNVPRELDVIIDNIHTQSDFDIHNFSKSSCNQKI